MAATYSSFMTTRFYSPVFNTALFDGPLRIYFSQSYESAALKIYHILQTQHADLWNQMKQCAAQSREHVFLMMYPEKKDLEIVFSDPNVAVHAQEWEEGLAVGFCQPRTDGELDQQLRSIISLITVWMDKSSSHDLSH